MRFKKVYMNLWSKKAIDKESAYLVGRGWWWCFIVNGRCCLKRFTTTTFTKQLQRLFWRELKRATSLFLVLPAQCRTILKRKEWSRSSTPNKGKVGTLNKVFEKVIFFFFVCVPPPSSTITNNNCTITFVIIMHCTLSFLSISSYCKWFSKKLFVLLRSMHFSLLSLS